MSYSERLHIIINSGNEGAPTSLYREGDGSGSGGGVSRFLVLRDSTSVPI